MHMTCYLIVLEKADGDKKYIFACVCIKIWRDTHETSNSGLWEGTV